jgi:hypothetical protein
MFVCFSQDNAVRFFDRKNGVAVYGVHAPLIARMVHKSGAHMAGNGLTELGLQGGRLSLSLYLAAHVMQHPRACSALLAEQCPLSFLVILAGVTVPYNLFPGLVRELLVERAEFNVELYEGSGTSWTLSKRGSPGMWRDFEAEISKSGELSDAPSVGAITFGQAAGEQQIPYFAFYLFFSSSNLLSLTM